MVHLRKALMVSSLCLLAACASRNQDTSVIDRMQAISKDGKQCADKYQLEANLQRLNIDSYYLANDRRYVIAMPHIGRVQYLTMTLLKQSKDGRTNYNACFMTMRMIHDHVVSIQSDAANQ